MTSHRSFLSRVTSSFVALAIVAGCSSSLPATPSPTPSYTPSQILSGIPLNRAVAYASIQSELTDFSDMWKTKGYGPASKAYLVPGEQLDGSESGPVLTSGMVTAFREGEWKSPDIVVAEVAFDLTFSGNSGAWGLGTNSRFVTATARTGTIPYVLEFATSR